VHNVTHQTISSDASEDDVVATYQIILSDLRVVGGMQIAVTIQVI